MRNNPIEAQSNPAAKPFRLWATSAMLLALILGTVPAVAQETCNNWQLINPLPSDQHLHGLAYYDGQYVVVGDRGTMLTSTDEVSWLQLPPLVEVDLNGITRHPDTLLIVGDDGTLINGFPELGWRVRSTPTDEDLLDSATRGGSTVVAVGANGTIIVSLDDLLTWSTPDSGTTVDLNGVAWTGSEYVAVGDDGLVLSSGDGLEWTPVDVDVDSTFTCVASNGALTVAFAIDGTLAWTTGDGSWNAKWAGPDITDVAWVGDRFLTAGFPRSSSDGVNWSWSPQLTEPGLELYAVGPSWGSTGEPPMPIAVGAGGTIAHSPDRGEHWKPSNTLTPLSIHGLANIDSVTVAVAHKRWKTGEIFASADLVNWEKVFERQSWEFHDVAISTDTFMTVGVFSEPFAGRPVILSSLDGRTWHETIDSTTGAGRPWTYYSITWDGARWIAGADNTTIAVSEDGSSWYLMTLDEQGNFEGVASNGDLIVAVGGADRVAISADGQSLAWLTVDSDQPLHGVAWGAGLFVAVGSSGTILSSHDGQTWTRRESGTQSELNTVRWMGESFVVLGADGVALHSDDGQVWTLMDLGTDRELWDMTVTPEGLVAGGEHGLIKRLACSDPDQPPTARFSWRPANPEVGAFVRFDDFSLGQPTGWMWNFGDGTTATTPTATHVYAEHGDWPVSLTVDSDSGSSTATAEISVRRFCGKPQAPTLSAPGSVPSNQPYTVSSPPPLQSWEHGDVQFHESRDPSFSKNRQVGTIETDPSREYTHSWTEGGLFFYRGLTINECPDGSYYSDYSSTIQVEIEPEITDLGEHLLVIPAAATGEGLKSTAWASNVVIHNPHAFDAPAYLVLLPRVGEGDAAIGSRESVAAGSSLHLEDALSGFEDATSGALVVASDRPLQVVSRAYNDQPEGTFGQLMTGRPKDDAPAAGQEATLIQLTENADFRTNLALANPFPEAVETRIDAYSADGDALGSTTYTVPGLSSVFDTQFLRRHTNDNLDDTYAIVAPTAPDGRLMAMASVVDNLTGDPATQDAHLDRFRHRAVMIDRPPVIFPNDWSDAVFAHGHWVAVGPDGLAVSADGLSWEKLIELPHSSHDLSHLAFNGDRIMAVGCEFVFHSDDGVTWTASEWSEGCMFDLTWDGDRWFAVVGAEGADTSTIATSADGVAWKTRPVEGLDLFGVIWGGDQYVGQTSHGMASSNDGLSWERSDLGFTLYDLAWSGSQYVAVNRTKLITSDDGRAWEIQEPDWALRRVVWAADRWVVGGNSHRWGEASAYLVSSDGTNWEAVSRPGSGTAINAMASGDATVMAIDFSGWVSFLVGDGPTVTIPAVAQVAGFGSSSWRSEVELHNPHQVPVSCTLELLERGEDNTEPESKEVTIEAATSLRLPDVLGELFEIDGAGALRVTPATDTIMVSSRTYDDGGAGTYGQLVPGFRASAVIRHFESGRLIALAHSPDMADGFRTNIGLVSNCAEPMTVTIDLHHGNGEALGSISAELRPFGVSQLNNVFSRVTSHGVTDGFATLVTTTARCSFFAYASVVDNRTNDPALIPVMPWNPDAEWW